MRLPWTVYVGFARACWCATSTPKALAKGRTQEGSAQSADPLRYRVRFRGFRILGRRFGISGVFNLRFRFFRIISVFLDFAGLFWIFLGLSLRSI